MAMRLCIGAVYSHAGLRWEPVYYDRIWTPTGFCDVIVQNVEVRIFVWEDNVRTKKMLHVASQVPWPGKALGINSSRSIRWLLFQGLQRLRS